MDIHEYQAKEILAKFGVTVPAGALAYSPEQAAYRARELGVLLRFGTEFGDPDDYAREYDLARGFSREAAARTTCAAASPAAGRA